MDPEETLRRIRVIGKKLTYDYSGSSGDFINLSLELSELTEALDRWISNGGFLPDSWKSKVTLNP